MRNCFECARKMKVKIQLWASCEHRQSFSLIFFPIITSMLDNSKNLDEKSILGYDDKIILIDIKKSIKFDVKNSRLLAGLWKGHSGKGGT